jgi:hypothetical protein
MTRQESLTQTLEFVRTVACSAIAHVILDGGSEREAAVMMLRDLDTFERLIPFVDQLPTEEE